MPIQLLYRTVLDRRGRCSFLNRFWAVMMHKRTVVPQTSSFLEYLTNSDGDAETGFSADDAEAKERYLSGGLPQRSVTSGERYLSGALPQCRRTDMD